MSINNNRWSSFKGNRALQLFIDRHHLIKHFAEYINNEPVAEKILFFYGGGGNGKSLLLKFLRTKCCHRFEKQRWQEILNEKYLKQLADCIAIPNNTNNFEQVPAVLHDFGLQPVGDDKPKDAFYGLLMLRRNIGINATKLKYKLRFPLFDFACVWYLHQKHQLSKEKWKELFPQEEFDFIMQMVDTLSETSWGAIANALFDVVSKKFGTNFYLIFQQRGLKKEDIEKIRDMDVDTELIFELPRLLAEDLNSAMSQNDSPQRLVLFFDTHEAFWGSQRDVADYRYFQQDKWLRYFLAELEFSQGIVVVVAGREKPRWQDADEYDIPQQHLDIQLVNHLAETDAREYLQRAGISNQDLQQNAIDYASVAENQIHPFLLGLCADVILQGKQGLEKLDVNADFSKKAKLLINRLLKYIDKEIDYTVHALSACRGFNYDIYELLGKELKFTTSKPNFDILTKFSFVWEAQERGEDWYRIHDLLRRLDYEEDNKTTRQAHQVLEKYYREKGEVAEAIYHVNRLDWERGVKEWVEKFDQVLKLSLYNECRILLEIRNKLVIQSDFWLGYISQSEGDYFATLALYQQAEQEYLEAIASYDKVIKVAPDDIAAHNSKGNALESLGNLQTYLSQHQDALISYSQAIASFDEALNRAPDNIAAHNNKGNALQSLGDLQARLSQHQDALNSYSQAIASYDEALNRAPDYINAHNNKGSALKNLGNLQASLSQHQDALTSYSQAIASYDEALNRAPDYINAHYNKGNALQSLGNLQASLSQHQDALISYSQAIASYDEALNRAPDYIYAHNNKGIALQSLGDLQTGLSQHQNALISYIQAIASYDEALNRAPDLIYAHNNKGIALQSLGDLQTGLSQHQDALISYSQAIASYDEALNRAPDDISAHNNKGVALQNLGNLQASLSQHQDALISYSQAIASFDEALNRAPDYINAHNNKGNALQSLGDLQTGLSQQQDALISYSQAIASYDEALNRAPDDISAHNNKGVALQNLGNLQASLSQHQDALISYSQAIASFDEALNRAPDYIQIHNNKGIALKRLGDLQTGLSQHQDALISYSQAIASYDEALNRAPDYINAHNNKGKALLGLGILQLNLSQKEEAIKSVQAALAEFNHCLKIAPDNEQVRNLRDKLQEFLDDLK